MLGVGAIDLRDRRGNGWRRCLMRQRVVSLPANTEKTARLSTRVPGGLHRT